MRFRPRNTAGNNFTGFSYVVTQSVEILVVDLLNTICSEPAVPATSEKSAHLLLSEFVVYGPV